MDAYSTGPAGRANGSVVIIQEIFGVNTAMREIADDFAAQGYACVVPDIFFRLERRVELGNGEDEPRRNRAIELMKRYDEVQGVQDLIAAARWMRANGPAGDAVCVLGFCLGGRLAALVAASGAVDCACSFYGVGLDQYLDRLAQISFPIQFHFGEADNQVPPATVDAVRGALARSSSKTWDVFTYPGAQHAFYNRHRTDRFDPSAYDLARSRVLDFLATALSARSAHATNSRA
jgi:carboxymethylenebutenolidase